VGSPNHQKQVIDEQTPKIDELTQCLISTGLAAFKTNSSLC